MNELPILAGIRRPAVLLGLVILAAAAQPARAQHTVTASATIVEPLQAGPSPVRVEAAADGLRASVKPAARVDSRVLEKAEVDDVPEPHSAPRTWTVRDGTIKLERRPAAGSAGVTVTRYVFANA